MSYLDILKSIEMDSLNRFKKSPVFDSINRQTSSESLASLGYEFVDYNILYSQTVYLIGKYKNARENLTADSLEELVKSIGGELYPTSARAFYKYKAIVKYENTSSDMKEACKNIKAVLYNQSKNLLDLFNTVFFITPDSPIGEGLTVLAHDGEVKDSLKQLKIIVDNLHFDDESILSSDEVKCLTGMLDVNYILQKHIINMYDFLIADQGYTLEDLAEDGIQPKIVSDDSETTSSRMYFLIAEDLKKRITSFDNSLSEYKFVEGEDLPLIELGVYLAVDEEFRFSMMYPAKV